MTESEAETMVRELCSELRVARAGVAAAQQRERGLRLLIDGYVILFPSLQSFAPEDPPPVPTRHQRVKAARVAGSEAP